MNFKDLMTIFYKEPCYKPFLVFTKDFLEFYIKNHYMTLTDMPKNFDKNTGYIGNWRGIPVYVLSEFSDNTI